MAVRTQYLDQVAKPESKPFEGKSESEKTNEAVSKRKLDIMGVSRDAFAAVAVLKSTDIEDIYKKVTGVTENPLIAVAVIAGFLLLMGRQ